MHQLLCSASNLHVEIEFLPKKLPPAAPKSAKSYDFPIDSATNVSVALVFAISDTPPSPEFCSPLSACQSESVQANKMR
jgi:hypothetical protein